MRSSARIGIVGQHLRRRAMSSAAAAVPASRHAYVGSYTGFAEQGILGWVGTANAGAGITHFLFDEASGKLTPTGQVVMQDSPRRHRFR